MDGRSLTGRRELLDAARAELTSRRGVLLYGPAGIGKSVALAALVASSTAQIQPPVTVLHCSPAEKDARLPYAGLVDLFARVPESCLEALAPEPQLALRSALLRGETPADDRCELAVRVAVLDVLRALTATGPVLLALDGLQWLDEPTAEVLAFVVRRIEGLDVRVVAAERVPDGEQPERPYCCPPGTVELPVPPLADDEVARLLDAELPPAVVRAVQDTAAGNPWYALELGRTAPRDGAAVGLGRSLPVPRRLRDLLLDQVRALPETGRRALLVSSAAARPTLTLLRAAGFQDPAADLAEAERLGIAVADADGTVRFRHPLVRAAVYADAPEHERRQAHALLARAVTELVERARHLALAHPYEEETTARTLMSAAESARRDGAPDTAFELAALAARRTPGERPVERADRLLAAAEYACDAGQLEEAGQAAETVLAGSGSARQRVRARLVLLRNAGQALKGAHALIEEVMATLVALTRIQVRAGHCREALDTAARCTRAVADTGVQTAPALYAAALAATAGGTAEEARHLAEQAVRASEADGDRLFLLRALAVLGQAELLVGDPRGAAAAAEALHRVKELGAAMSAADPPLLHWYSDLAEALVVLGETDEAGAVIDEARKWVSVDAPGSVLAALERAEGLREAGLGRAKEGAVRLRAAVDRLRQLPLPVDLVRTLIALGAVERRARHRNAARTALGEALETATRIGAAPLAARAGDELARLEAGDRDGEGHPELTPTEARIAELVGGGATNREVAAELFISVKTVEGTLSRVYRKVGVRSRTALAHAMAVAVIASGAATVSVGDDDQQQLTAQAVTISQPGRVRAPRTLDNRR